MSEPGDGDAALQTDERRRRRAAAQERFDELAVDYLARPGVTSARMFGSEGLKSHDKFFAFLDADGGMIVKVPAESAAALVADGAAVPVRVGRHPAREWVSVPEDGDGDLRRWREVLAEAYAYACG